MNRPWIDLHCDTVFELIEQKQELSKNTLHLDLARMEEYESYIQVFAAFVDQKSIRCTPFQHCKGLLDKMREEIQKNSPKLSLITNDIELDRIRHEGGLGAILAIEGGEALEGDLKNLVSFYEMGARLITLTWNYANELADGITEPRGGGLTDFGKQAVSAMEKFGILIDVSHLSKKGFWDVAKLANHPFIASHSCAQTLCDHPRNLDDDQIDFLIQNNGGIGINFYPDFLTKKTPCTIENIVDHMEYILSRGGDSVLGFGSDFDGVSSLPVGMNGIQDMKKLVSAMKHRGFTDLQIEKIRWINFYEILREAFHRSGKIYEN